MKQVVWWALALGGLFVGGCSNDKGGTGNQGGSGNTAGSPGTSGKTLAGTWDLTTTPLEGDVVMTTVVLGQDSLAITSPDFNLTATRSGDTVTYTDEQTVNIPADDVLLTAKQSAGSFNAGIVPFDLGGSWMITIAPASGGSVMTCTLSVGASEIDGSCRKVTDDGFDFDFTTAKQTSAVSSFGDLGGTWLHTWTQNGSANTCALDFGDASIKTCPGTLAGGGSSATPVSGITFDFDGADTVSGTLQGWAEFSATRR
ncbi:MAG TPA: hypothetical protein VMI54_26305 [Polyangiaceae bacterium]|nr:hypothetical protein [Polyangiaceae bacterium]